MFQCLLKSSDCMQFVTYYCLSVDVTALNGPSWILFSFQYLPPLRVRIVLNRCSFPHHGHRRQENRDWHKTSSRTISICQSEQGLESFNVFSFFVLQLHILSCCLVVGLFLLSVDRVDLSHTHTHTRGRFLNVSFQLFPFPVCACQAKLQPEVHTSRSH